MTKALIIAEKPSVAKDIVKALSDKLGRFNDHGDYFENDQYIVSSAVGHLVEIFAEEAEVKPRWSLARLPIIPKGFDIRPRSDDVKPRLNMLVGLIGRKDVDTLINACDAGREGELIFRLIVQYAAKKKSVDDKIIKRLWLQSMTKEAIQAGFENLRSDLQMKDLEYAARCRSEADWMIGINGSRAMTAYNSNGSFVLTTVGRVQTPTLSMIADREDSIQAHTARKYHEVYADIWIPSGETYRGKFFDPKWKKGTDPDDRADRIWNEAEALHMVKVLDAKLPSSITDEPKSQTRHSPGLFDLTTLQREANMKFGMSAKNTLATAQALYEKHKVLTYPRTDSKHLPEDYLPTVFEHVKALTKDETHAVAAQKALDKNMLIKTKKIFDNSQITDHFAIIPTGKLVSSLDEYERKIFDLVVRRFLAAFYPPAEIDVVVRTTIVKDHHFRSEGKVLRVPGWMEVYGKSDDSNDVVLPVITEKSHLGAIVNHIEAQEKATKPPARFNEATLLGAMENVSKTIEGDEAKAAMKEKGLGTPATRAAVIEGLINDKYVNREGKDMVPTEKAVSLMKLLKGLKIDLLTNAEMTGEWEAKLGLMENQKFSRETFMAEIGEVTKYIVQQAKTADVDSTTDVKPVEGSKCPSCGKPLSDGYRSYFCASSCGVSLPKIVVNRAISPSEIVHLTTTGPLGPVGGFKSRFGKSFDAGLIIGQKGDRWDILLSFPKREEELVKAQGEALCQCKLCKKKVYDYGSFYACEDAIKTEARPKPKCAYKIAKTLLGKTLEPDTIIQLTKQDKTDVITGFTSKTTTKSFDARLKWDEKQKRTSFVFDEDPNRPKGNGKKKGGFKKRRW